MDKWLIRMCFAVVIINYVEAGVITSASVIRNTNNIDIAVKYPESNNEILEEFGLQTKSTLPKKYWVSKNIPLFKKIPREFSKTMKKLSKYPDTFYKELYGINKIEEKVKTRVHNVIKTNIKLDVNNNPSPLLIDFLNVGEEQTEKQIQNVPNIDDVVEISLLLDDDATTEDIAPNLHNEMQDDNQKLLKEFIRSHTVIPTKSGCHSDSSEEKKDLDEFIFMLDPQRQEDGAVDDGDMEMTTQSFITQPRLKRSAKMIEEENLGTTITGFKFTGHDTRLSNDVYYKNIHS